MGGVWRLSWTTGELNVWFDREEGDADGEWVWSMSGGKVGLSLQELIAREQLGLGHRSRTSTTYSMNREHTCVVSTRR